MGTVNGRYRNRDAAIKAYDAGRTVYRVLAMIDGKPFQGYYTKREAQRLAALVGGEASPVDPHAAIVN
jgi:hypothetical protein